MENKIDTIIKQSFIKDLHVIVDFAPISERYWNQGITAIIRNGQIRLGGVWFDFNEKYKLEFILD